jgi:hypothetical protein
MPSLKPLPMLMYRKIYTISVLFLFLIAGSCKKEHYPQYWIHAEVKEYTYFEKGSWWVYKEKNSGNLDTVQVVMDSMMAMKIHNNAGYASNSYLSYYASTFDPLDTMIVSSSVVVNFTVPLAYTNSTTGYSYFRTAYEGVASFFSDAQVGDTLKLVDKRLAIYRRDTASLELEGRVYTSVRVFECNVPPNNTAKLPKVVYYAKNVGVIQKELFNGEVWRLMNYSVKQ